MSPDIDWKKAQPLPKAVAKALRVNFPMITATGIFNDRNVAGTTKKSSHAEGRAIDVHLNANKPNDRVVGDELFRALIDAAHATGIDNVIWNRQIWSIHKPTIRQYSGVNPHTDHIHVEFTREGSQQQAFHLLELKIAQLRTGLEELSVRRGSTG
jgi:hypothetical protein